MKFSTQSKVALAVGIFVGLAVGTLAKRGEPFSIVVLDQVVAIKINRRTGETWRSHKGGPWEAIQDAPKPAPDLLDQIDPDAN